MPKLTLTRALAAAVLLSIGALASLGAVSLAGGQTFSDVPPSNQFYDDIEFMSERGIAGGFPDGTYRPGQAVSRQAMAAFLHRALSYEVVATLQGAANTASTVVTATCPAGTSAVSGGGRTTGNDVFITDSYPGPLQTQWTVRFETEDNVMTSISSTAYAVCAPIDLTP
jgi:hypothetical protein